MSGLFCVRWSKTGCLRAQITRLRTFNVAEVFYLDVGIYEKVKISFLRYMHKDFAQLPCQAIYCRLSPEGSAAINWDKRAIDRFIWLTHQESLQVRALSLDPQVRCGYLSVWLSLASLSLSRRGLSQSVVVTAIRMT